MEILVAAIPGVALDRLCTGQALRAATGYTPSTISKLLTAALNLISLTVLYSSDS
jgi:hypothetical protein